MSVTGLPDRVSDAGHGFSYVSWPAGTSIVLANVNWGSDYRDVVEFDSKQAFLNYILGLPDTQTIRLESMTYARAFQPLKLPVPFDIVSRYNYILVRNPVKHPNQYDNHAAWNYGYFITSVEMINPGTTSITVQLDVWQTYSYTCTFGSAFLERGHLPMHPGYVQRNADLVKLSTPEGIDTGSEYVTRELKKLPLRSGSDTQSVVILSTVDLDWSGGTVDNPKLNSATGGVVRAGGDSQRLRAVNGADIYTLDSVDSLAMLMADLSHMPWMSQGIISVMIVPKILEPEGNTFRVESGGSPGIAVVRKLSRYKAYREIEVTVNWESYVRHAVPEEFRDLKKFFTYPYSFFEVTTYAGKPLVVKPERISSRGFKLGTHSLVTPPTPRTAIWPLYYNHGHETVVDEYAPYDTGEHLDFATWISNYPQTSIVNNSYLNYLASNANQLAYQHDSADWSQQRALMGAQAARAQAQGAMGAVGDMAAFQRSGARVSALMANDAAMQQSMVSSLGGVAGGVMSGGVGGLAGMAIGGAMAGVSGATNMVNTSISNTNRSAQTNLSNSVNELVTGRAISQMGLVADTNFELSSSVARGDYHNAIAGINARVQDAQMIQPTISGQIGGEGFNVVTDDGFTIRVKTKMVDYNVMAMVADYWRRFGYAVNRYINLSEHGGRKRLRCMTKFSYWKLKEVNLVSSQCPETFRQTIRGILEKGVTIWSNPNDIGRTRLTDNAPVDLGYSGDL